MMLRWISLVPPPTVLVVAYRYMLSARPLSCVCGAAALQRPVEARAPSSPSRRCVCPAPTRRAWRSTTPCWARGRGSASRSPGTRASPRPRPRSRDRRSRSSASGSSRRSPRRGCRARTRRGLAPSARARRSSRCRSARSRASSSPTYQPRFSSPIRFSFGTRTLSKNTSLKSWLFGHVHERPDRDAGRLHVEDEVADALCFGASGSVRASRIM